MLRDSLHIPDLIPNLWFITGFVTRLKRRVSLVEQELLTLPNHLSSPSGSCYSIFSFICMFCRSLFVLFLLAIVLSVLLRFTDSDRPLVSSNSSYSFFGIRVISLTKGKMVTVLAKVTEKTKRLSIILLLL